MDQYAQHCCWVPSHTGVNGNEREDGAALDANSLITLLLVQSQKNDFKNFIKDQVNSLWATEWINIVENKLKSGER